MAKQSTKIESTAPLADEQKIEIAAYTEAKKTARKNGLGELWDETDREIRLHVKARGWQEIQQELAARQLMPALFPIGCTKAAWTAADSKRVAKAIGKLSTELDAQLDELTRITWDLYSQPSNGSKRGNGLSANPHKLGLQCSLLKPERQNSKARRLAISAKHYQSAVGTVKAAIGSLTSGELLLVRNILQRGYRLVPPAWLLDTLLGYCDDMDDALVDIDETHSELVDGQVERT